MANALRRRRSSRQHVATELEVLPLMNLFIVLIPMLLLSAVFIEISVIDMSMPADAQAQEQPQRKPLGLSIRVGHDAYVVSGRGLETRTIARGGAQADEASAWAELTEALASIVSAHPDNKDVRIIAEETTRYEEIIAVMDVSRETGLPQTALVGVAGASR